MRILVLQLARFGDIYQTWPVLRALRRQGAEVHLLVRERFHGATEGLEGIIVHRLPTAGVLEPILIDGDEQAALQILSEVLVPLEALKFDKIVNLSFSPASSYLTDILSTAATEVRGYTRHTDGFLNIPDDSSAYFYAQFGIERSNRYHLTDVFAAIADVTLEERDFVSERYEKCDRLVIHLGASQVEKVYPAELWIEVIKQFSGRFLGEIVLVGSRDERALSETVVRQADALEIRNLVGETTLNELFKKIGTSRLLIGADSAPIHIAALVDTPVLNISSRATNFWESGPISRGSRVLYEEQIGAIEPQAIAREALNMLNSRPPSTLSLAPSSTTCFERVGDKFVAHNTETRGEFAWRLIEALYTGAPYPSAHDQPNEQAIHLAFQRLFELADLALHQLANWDEVQSERVHVLSSIDQLLEEIPKLCTEVAPAVRWFQTQRLRLKPDSVQATLQATRKLFEELLWIAAVYHQSETNPSTAIELCTRLAPALREFEFGHVEGEFQSLVAQFQELARHSTKVGGRLWSSVLKDMNEALLRRDYIELADQLEFELKPTLHSLEPR